MDNNTPTSSYSLTQGANIATFAAAISLLLSHPDFTNPANIQTILTALVMAVTAAISFYGRYRKGDVTPVGFRKQQ